VTVGKLQRASQVAADSGLDDANSRLMDSFARILVAIDLASQAQAIEVALGETAVAGRAVLDRRQ
jgi:hypothetical protein